MKKLTLGLLLLLTMSVFGQQQPTNSDLRKQIEAAQTILESVQKSLPPDPVQVKDSAGLTAALLNGGIIELDPAGTYEGRFTIAKSFTTVKANGAKFDGKNDLVWYIKPGTNDVSLDDFSATTSLDGAVIQCGDNGPTQTTRELVPQRISFTKVVIPTHRGKRGFEINCSGSITNSMVLDVYAASLQDSQAVWVGNTCGPFLIKGGEFVAASENILMGGDTMKIPCTQTGIVIDGANIHKPESWHTDTIAGVKRGNKNLVEFKACIDCQLINSTLSGSWKDGQDGWAIVITPRNSLTVKNILIDNVKVDRCGGAFQMQGKDNVTITPEPLSGVVIRNSVFSCTDGKTAYGGRGIFALVSGGAVGGGVRDVTVDNVTWVGDGNAIIQADTPANTPQGPFTITNSKMTIGQYGITAPGSNFGNPPTGTYIGKEMNTFITSSTLAAINMSSSALSQFKKNFPNNTYVTAAELNALISVARRKK